MRRSGAVYQSVWINPRFGAPKPAIGSITYKPQGYDRMGKHYEEELTFV